MGLVLHDIHVIHDIHVLHVLMRDERRKKERSKHVHVHGCAVLLCLVCLFDLACFFLSSFSSLI